MLTVHPHFSVPFSCCQRRTPVVVHAFIIKPHQTEEEEVQEVSSNRETCPHTSRPLTTQGRVASLMPEGSTLPTGDSCVGTGPNPSRCPRAAKGHRSTARPCSPGTLPPRRGPARGPAVRTPQAGPGQACGHLLGWTNRGRGGGCPVSPLREEGLSLSMVLSLFTPLSTKTGLPGQG